MTPAGDTHQVTSGRTNARGQGWDGMRICVAGIGVSGDPAARALAARGARVTVVDGRDGDQERARAESLRELGVTVWLGAGDALPDDTDLVVTSPGWRPTAPLLVGARRRDVPVISEVELAWRLRPAAGGAGPGETGGSSVTAASPAAWLALTGTNGKTSTVRMLAAILVAAGYRAAAAGNVGVPLLDAVLADPPYDVLAVELSSYQLHWTSTMRPQASAVLNVAPDHLDWHGSLEAYTADKGRIFTPGAVAVCNADDPTTVALASASDGAARTVSFTLAEPGPGQLGVVAGRIVDRAYGDGEREAEAGTELASVSDVAPTTPHNVANALAAAALARAYGVPPDAVTAGLRAFQPDPHRVADVATVGGARYIDDSKATNPHAAAASLSAFPSVVWIVGGQLKGADISDLVATSVSHLRGAVLIGEDRAQIREAFERHAPDVPSIEVTTTDTGAMQTVVAAAADLARPGDIVLLAPAGASFDMFADYGARGDAFAAAVRLLAEDRQ